MVREIKYFTDPILTTPTDIVSLPITDLETLSLIKDMEDTMYHMRAFGVAANQIGASKRMFVIDTAWANDPHNTEKKPKLFINPEITAVRGEEVQLREGCLSFPDAFVNNLRNSEIAVQYAKIDGEIVQEYFTGIEAIAIQHEIEHLDGKLFIDNMGPVKRRMVIDKANKTIKKIRRHRR